MHITQGAVKIIELVGVSTKSFDDAVAQAVAKSAQSIDGITGLQVLHFSAQVDGNRITEYHANVKVAFAVK